jgi:hypothetical protein
MTPIFIGWEYRWGGHCRYHGLGYPQYQAKSLARTWPGKGQGPVTLLHFVEMHVVSGCELQGAPRVSSALVSGSRQRLGLTLSRGRHSYALSSL